MKCSVLLFLSIIFSIVKIRGQSLYPNAWDLTYTNAVYEDATTSIVVTYATGNATSVESTSLRLSDCVTPYSSPLLTTSTISKVVNAYSYRITVDTSKIDDLNPAVSYTSGVQTGNIDFCSVLERSLSGFTNTSITTSELRFALNFDLTNLSFSNAATLSIVDADTLSSSFQTADGVTVCQCNATSYSCTREVVGQSELAHFCVTPSSEELFVSDITFSLQIPDGSYTYNPDLADDAPLAISNVCETCSPKVYRYSILLVSGLFASDFDYLNITGSATLEFAARGLEEGRKDFETTLKLKREDSTQEGILGWLMSFVDCF